jgi:hypothetical protein
MTPKDLANALDRLGLTQVGFGRLIGYGSDGSIVRKWVSGRSPIPPLVTRVVCLLRAGKITVADLEALE